MKWALLGALMLPLFGCASTKSTEVPNSGGVRVCDTSTSFFTLVGSGAADAELECQAVANKDCEKEGKRARIVSALSSNATVVSVAHAKIQYQCVDGELLVREQKAQEEAAAKAFYTKAQETCTGYGFKQGSEMFANCMMTQDQNRINQYRQDVADEQARQLMIEQQSQQDAQRMQQQIQGIFTPKPTTTCTTIGNRTTCQ